MRPAVSQSQHRQDAGSACTRPPPPRRTSACSPVRAPHGPRACGTSRGSRPARRMRRLGAARHVTRGLRAPSLPRWLAGPLARGRAACVCVCVLGPFCSCLRPLVRQLATQPPATRAGVRGPWPVSHPPPSRATPGHGPSHRRRAPAARPCCALLCPAVPCGTLRGPAGPCPQALAGSRRANSGRRRPTLVPCAPGRCSSAAGASSARKRM